MNFVAHYDRAQDGESQLRSLWYKISQIVPNCSTSWQFDSRIGITNLCYLYESKPKYLVQRRLRRFIRAEPSIRTQSDPEALHVSVTMCWGSQDEGRPEQPRPVELATRVPRGIQEPETLEDLGYFAFESGYTPDPSDPFNSPQIFCFTINLVDSGPDDPHIAIIGANEEKGLLVVKEIYLNRDTRRRRPISAAVYFSFWHHFRQQPVENLRMIFFESAIEDTLMDIRGGIYEHMHLDRMDRLTLSRHGDTRAEQEAFKEVYNDSPFGRCAKTMVTQNRAMKRAGIKVSRFKFLPVEPSGTYFDFSVTFRAPSAHHSQHRGHGRH